MPIMKKTAVLLDLGFVLHKLYKLLGNRNPTAIEVRAFASRCIKSGDEELFRIYCYHCLPYSESQVHPLTRNAIDFSSTPTYAQMTRFIKDLKVTDNVAFRAGELSFDGWTIKKRAAEDIIQTGRALVADDFQPDLKQKGVDMKIGLDVAWLASKNIVERIVLVAADSDFIPAMKFARREGIQVILVTLGHRLVKQEVLVHADELRSITYP
jgi:uncharacterized LabA/DUF88 family protein